MKAAKHYRQEWEEAQFLQLFEFAAQIYRGFIVFFKILKLIFNLVIFIIYQLMKLTWNIARIAFLTQATNQLMRDEQWIYRQIK